MLSTAEDSHLSSRTGMLIVQRVLLSHLSLLYSCLNPANPPEVIKSALKLLTAMVTQEASAAREVQRSFDFTLKSLSSLPNKRDSKVQYIEILYLFILLILLAFFKGCSKEGGGGRLQIGHCMYLLVFFLIQWNLNLTDFYLTKSSI